MGLFDAFKKKQCDICGGEIGMLGNRKLEDGNLCRTCAKKLSPWFDERRHSTVDQINEQLAYRETNKSSVAAFRVTRVFGESTKLYLDEDAGVFLVTDEPQKKWDEDNPDVVAFGDVTGVEVDVDESRTEHTRQDADGKSVSYNPPRYTYYYNFNLIIHVRHPYFDTISFRLNRNQVDIESVGGGALRGGFGAMRFGGSGFNASSYPEYQQYMAMGEEIKTALLAVRQQSRDAAAAAAAPKAAVNCPWCGATTTPDANGRCEYCGGSLGG